MADQVVWRTSLGARIASTGLGLLLAASATATATGKAGSHAAGVAGFAFSVAAVVSAVGGPWLLAFRPRIILTATTVTVVNPFRSITVRLELVRPRVGPDHRGVVIAWFSNNRRKSTQAWAVQRNLVSWTGRPSRADDVRDAIAQAAERAPRSPA
ncbi:hypothetical protein M6D93_01435 [Jatrophihabitans telluris]|uniref:PH domain-containing protein n=1 Tax=Jatrophihabitans telluris TaxID=2038343 RepID=A0ABY4R021_9ACTN|nr:hypothetical protein [Jatrophihabitans telluris]UQX88677.1 hypothetical protein M6D93_01435 [Jatrophihabitans telluris]